MKLSFYKRTKYERFCLLPHIYNNVDKQISGICWLRFEFGIIKGEYK